MKYKKYFSIKIFQILGVFLFIYIFKNLDLEKFIGSFSQINIWLFLVAVPLILLIIFIKSMRWRSLLSDQNVFLEKKESFFVYLYGVFWGVITPAMSGEFSKIFYLKNKGVSFLKGSIATIQDRIFDLLVIFLFGYTGLLFFGEKFRKEILIVTIFVLAASFIIFLLFLLRLPKTKEIINSFRSLKKGQILNGILTTICAWIIYFIQVYILNLALGLEIPFIYITAAVSITSAINLLPISVSGLGTRDFVFITIFSQITITQEKAVALSTLVFAIFLINGMMGWLAGFFLRRKHPAEMRESNLC